MDCLVATTERAFPKATVELEASLSTQAVARSRVSRVESENDAHWPVIKSARGTP